MSPRSGWEPERAPREAIASLTGETIAAATLEQGVSTDRESDEYDRLTLVTGSGRRLVLKTQDSEGYSSWLELVR